MKTIASCIIGLILGWAAAAYAEEVRLTTVTGTTAQTAIVGARNKVCIYCTTGSIRYTVGKSGNLVTATTSAPAIDFPGDCYRIKMPLGTDRLSIIHKDGTSSFTCEINAVDP